MKIFSKLPKGTLSWLSEISGKKKYLVMGLLPIDAFFAVNGVIRAFIFRSLIDSAVAKDKHSFMIAVLYMALLTVFGMVLSCIYSVFWEWTNSSIEISVKSHIFSNVLTKDYSKVSSIHSGEWMNRLTKDVSIVSDGITNIVPDLMGTIISLISAAVAIIIMEPVFAMIMIPGGLIIVVITYFFRKILKRLHKDIREADGKVYEFLQERLSSMMIIRTFGMEHRMVKGAEERMLDYRSKRLKRTHFSNLCNSGFGLAASAAYLGGAVFCGFQILDGLMTYGTMMAILQLISQIQSPFASLTGFIPRVYAMLASAERLMEVEDFPSDSKKPLPQKEIHRFYEADFTGLGLDQVAFTYKDRPEEDTPEVFGNLSIDIRKGEYVALTGHSGSGKSTVFKLLMGIYPIDGGIRYVDTVDGQKELDGSYRSLFAYVPQGNQLMSGTIRDIIAFGDVTRMEDEDGIKKALEMSCADEFVASLPDGLNTVLGERGTGLSEGQMQRIAIARAIFSDRPILLLDESTSALDEETEQRLLENIRCMSDKTVVIVTHRPAALGICDKQVGI